MKRKDKYLVVKREDIARALLPEQQDKLELLLNRVQEYRAERGLRTEKKYVVVSDKLDCYDHVWRLIALEVDNHDSNDTILDALELMLPNEDEDDDDGF